MVEAAAVIGRSGDLALLRSVAGADVDVDTVSAELVEAQVFETEGSERWRFRHELLREVAAELAPPSLQRELHARVARELVQAATGMEPDWRLVARHYESVQRFDEAVIAYQKACVEARASRRSGGGLRTCPTNAPQSVGPLRNRAATRQVGDRAAARTRLSDRGRARKA